MQRFLLSLSLMLVTPVTSYADAPTGNSLKNDCSETSTYFQRGSCSGYIAGVSDMLFTAHRICYGPNVTRGQIEDVVIKYLNDNPAIRDQIGIVLIEKSLRDAFPCKGIP
jgi:hypothetical protein